MYANKIFTEKELKVFGMKREGLSNKDIAKKLNVSEADISQTLMRIKRKIKTVRDSIELLMSIGVIKEGPKYVLTPEGRELTESRIAKAPPKFIEASKTYNLVYLIPKTNIIGLNIFTEKLLGNQRYIGYTWDIKIQKSKTYAEMGV